VHAATNRQVPEQVPDHLVLEADLPVGHEHDLALRVFPERRQSLFDGMQHLGAAGGFEMADSIDCALD